MQLCGTDRTQIPPCLREKYAELSETCANELRERMQQRGGREGAGRRGTRRRELGARAGTGQYAKRADQPANR